MRKLIVTAVVLTFGAASAWTGPAEAGINDINHCCHIKAAYTSNPERVCFGPCRRGHLN